MRTGTKDITGIDDLAGRTVIVGANTPAVTALTQNRGDAYVQDLTILASDAKANPRITVVGHPFTKEPYGIGLRHGDTEFKTFVNTWLKKIQDGGQWTRAWKSSLGTVVDSDPPTPPVIGSAPGS